MEYIGDIPHLTNHLDINLQRDLQIDFTWRYISWMIMPLIGPPSITVVDANKCQWLRRLAHNWGDECSFNYTLLDGSW